MRKLSGIYLAALLLLSVAANAGPRAFGAHGFGPRVGVSIDPDQIHFGGHLDLGDLAPNLMLLPNADIGIGDDLTIVTALFELDYRFRSDWGSWNPYLGGAIGPSFWSFDGGRGRGDNSDSGLAASVQGGIARRLGSQSGFMFLEFRLGMGDMPDFKFTAGWCFGSK